MIEKSVGAGRGREMARTTLPRADIILGLHPLAPDAGSCH